MCGALEGAEKSKGKKCAAELQRLFTFFTQLSAHHRQSDGAEGERRRTCSFMVTLENILRLQTGHWQEHVTSCVFCGHEVTDFF